MAFKYTGLLAKRRPYKRPPTPFATDEARKEWDRREAAESAKRWRALFAAHHVDYGDGFGLLMQLIEAHVPGFSMKSLPGPKNRVWTAMNKAFLRIAVDDYIAQCKRAGRRANVGSACFDLSRTEPWKWLLRKEGANPREALRGHYNTANRALVKLIREWRRHKLLEILREAGRA